MCQVSVARMAYCEGIILKQAAREVKAEPSPDAMRRLRELVLAYGLDIFDILERYINGGLSAESAQDLFLSLATDNHRAAHILGQEVAAVQVMVPGLAADRGRMLGLTELSYFRGFLNALDGTDARYFDADAGEWRMDQVARRAGMYTPKAESSASWGWVDNHEARQQFNWILGAGDHCEDCPILAGMSPFYRETMFTMPREGQTPCRHNCIVDGDAMVTTAKGLVPISKIRPGDMVLTHKGRYRRVRASWKHLADSPREVYATVSPDGTYVRTTGDHRMWSEKGWVTARDCAKHELLVYTTRHGHMSKMRAFNAARQKGDALLRLRAGVQLRGEQGQEGGYVPELRKQSAGNSTVGLGARAGQENVWAQVVRGAAAQIVRGLGTAALQQHSGRRACDGKLLDPGGGQGLLLPFPLGVGASQWGYSRWVACSPQERRLLRRQAGESRGFARRGASQTAHESGQSGVNGFGEGGDLARAFLDYLREMRDSILCPSGQPAREAAQVLFAGVCRHGATLYDIEVEEDESFVVEGVVVHNCKCRVETVQGVASFDPVELDILAQLGLAA